MKPTYQDYQQQRRRDLENRARCLWHGARHRAKASDVPFEITREWVLRRLRQGHCERTTLPFVFTRSRGPFSPSIDRRDPGLGYTEQNARVVIWLYNCAKGTSRDTDVLIMARALLGQSNEGDFSYLTQQNADFLLDPETAHLRLCCVCQSPFKARATQRYCSIVCQIKAHCVGTELADGCWVWTGAAAHASGMVTLTIDGKVVRMSPARAMYLAVHGFVSAGEWIKTTCRTRGCCNPAHLKQLKAAS